VNSDPPGAAGAVCSHASLPPLPRTNRTSLVPPPRTKWTRRVPHKRGGGGGRTVSPSSPSSGDTRHAPGGDFAGLGSLFRSRERRRCSRLLRTKNKGVSAARESAPPPPPPPLPAPLSLAPRDGCAHLPLLLNAQLPARRPRLARRPPLLWIHAPHNARVPRRRPAAQGLWERLACLRGQHAPAER